ncbi:MAG: M1 family metallopeptidase [Bacteroidia bacterium]
MLNTWKIYKLLIVFVFINYSPSFGQSNQLDGKLSKIRAAFDVKNYKIRLRVEPEKKYISGENEIYFKAIKTLNQIQLDLDTNIKITGIKSTSNPVNILRLGRTIILTFQSKIPQNSLYNFTVYFEGFPKIAKKAPWDGGFVFDKDSSGKPWVGMACEGEGASMWLPCKDTWDDEPDQMQMELEVPQGLMGISNGRLTGSEKLNDAYERFRWNVTYPINHYNISINIGDYAHIHDLHTRPNLESLSLDYYVLRYNEQKAKKHFEQSKYMLRCFEKYFGPYPFQNDGYKLVETPYWGMEHQSCVAYGNNYKNNDFGFDFIIIHESGHEWFANSITAKDKADMWIHESFTTYMESLFVECMAGPERAKDYLIMQKPKINLKYPMLGERGQFYHHADNDIYYKGTWMLHTLRNMVDNDTLWQNTLYEFHQTFQYKTILTEDIVRYFSKRLKMPLKQFFKNYLEYAEIPVFEYYILHKNGLHELHYRLLSPNSNLELPLQAQVSKSRFDMITATPQWQIIDLPYEDENLFQIKPSSYLIDIKKIKK